MINSYHENSLPDSLYSGASKSLQSRRSYAVCVADGRLGRHVKTKQRVYNTILPHVAKRQKFATEKQTGQEDEEQLKDQEHVTDSLYVMTNSLLPNDVKIGRSADVNQRRKSLEASQHFNILVHAEFPGYGYLERDVHGLLKKYQVKNVKGKEWFRISVAHALRAIASIMLPFKGKQKALGSL